ncbi:hypothetical protein GY45DRAFT_786442 [Cubamyces sp. BRFM 1775]|nr:hypothetical protein GY45DRAFT_786442 [Cubamyces sp. BRFM 1775]
MRALGPARGEGRRTVSLCGRRSARCDPGWRREVRHPCCEHIAPPIDVDASSSTRVQSRDELVRTTARSRLPRTSDPNSG